MIPIRYQLEESGWVGLWPRVTLERWAKKDGEVSWVIQVHTGIYLNADTLLFEVAKDTMKCGFSSAEEANEFWVANRKKIFKKHSKREW